MLIVLHHFSLKIEILWKTLIKQDHYFFVSLPCHAFFCSFSSVASRLLEKRIHPPPTAFTKLLQCYPCQAVHLEPSQLSQSRPDQLQVLAGLSHCLPLTEKPQLPWTEWDLFFQDLPSSQREHQRPESTRCGLAWGLHPHWPPKAWI